MVYLRKKVFRFAIENKGKMIKNRKIGNFNHFISVFCLFGH